MKKIGLILLLTNLFCNSAQAFSVTHDFRVILGPFEASQTEFVYNLSPSKYSVNSKVRTSGFFDTLYPFMANYATSGRIKKNNLETQSYHYDSKSRFSKRKKELIYNENGQPIMRISSKNDKEKKVEIEQSTDNKDTTDLQTVFAELAKQYNTVHFCNARMQVFDGKRRFDVIFQDEGEEELQPNQYTKLGGPSAKCSMYIDKLGAEGDDLLWQLSSDRPIYFWLSETPEKKPFIARIEIEDTPLGRLQVYTQNVTVKE